MSAEPGNRDERPHECEPSCSCGDQYAAAAAAQPTGGEADETTRPETAGKNLSDDAGRVGRHPGQSPQIAGSPAPSAGQDTGQLRDEIEDVLVQAVGGQMPRGKVWRPGPVVDALLSGPLARLVAERDEARATVQRVRELADEWESVPHGRGQWRPSAGARIRRALDAS